MTSRLGDQHLTRVQLLSQSLGEPIPCCEGTQAVRGEAHTEELCPLSTTSTNPLAME